MSLDKLVDSTQLDSDLTSVANAIRAKSGGSGQLAFPSGFVSEIGNIPSGGTTEVTISDSGTVSQALDSDKLYHFTGDLTSLTITLNGTPGISEYQFDFIVGSTIPTVSFPSGVSVPLDFCVLARGKTTVIVYRNSIRWLFEPIISSGYTRVSCVKIPLGGFVDTGKKPYNKINEVCADARIDTEIQSLPDSSGTIFGCKEGTTKVAIVSAYKTIAGFVFQFASGANSYASVGTVDNNRHRFFCGIGMSEVALDATKASKISTSSLPSRNLLIGARQNANNDGYEAYAELTVWQYYHKQNFEIVINLFPCKRDSDSEYGFFDTVSGNFFGNSGTGTFTEGVE